AEEAMWLGRLVIGLLPDEPEARGLLALMLHCEARRGARRDAAGRHVPPSGQGVSRRAPEPMAEGGEALVAASRTRRPGRFQLEAAIQSVHAQRARSGHTDWESIALLYEGLMRSSPSIGAQVGRAAALAEAKGTDAGLAALRSIPPAAVESYQPYWALAAHLFRRRGQEREAQEAYARAAGLSEDEAVREFLVTRSSLTSPQ